MKCYKCGSFLYENDHCAECGADVSTYRKIVKKSNELYNRALKMARDRNLSGAIQCLQVSVRMYKANIGARNLLGLIYVETGEYAMGLAQWVISKSLQSENNMADHFLNELQSSRQDLNMMNVSIRKYNKAIGYIKQGNYDLAEIQLKKLLNDNTNMVKGHQLLALLFIRKKKYAEARNALKKAQQIDQGDPVTISYMAMVEAEIKEEEQELSPTELRNKRISEKADTADHTPLSGDDVIIPKSSYREYNPATMTILQILIGVVIGAAIIFFIVMPAKSKAVRAEFSDEIASLHNQIESMERASEAREEEIAAVPETEPEDPSFESLVLAQAAVNNGDLDKALEEIEKVDTSKLSAQERTYYDSLNQSIRDTLATSQFEEGVALYEAAMPDESVPLFTQAAEKLKSAYDTGFRSGLLLYYLGRSYDYMSDETNTVKYLQEFIDNYPDDDNAVIAQQIINSWNR